MYSLQSIQLSARGPALVNNDCLCPCLPGPERKALFMLTGLLTNDNKLVTVISEIRMWHRQIHSGTFISTHSSTIDNMLSDFSSY